MAGVKSSPKALAVVAIGSCAIVGALALRAAPTLTPLKVVAAAQRSELAAASVVGPARLEPASGEVDLSVDRAGVLDAIPVKEGDRVRQGQLLAELANRDAASRVDAASATLQMQEARLEKLKKGPRREERQQAVAAIQEQDATLNRLDRELARQKLLYRQGYASNAQLEQAESARNAVAAKKTSSAEALAEIDAGPRREDVASAQAEVKLAEAQLGEARAELEKTRVRAPIDGVVLRVYKHPGEAVGPGPTSAILQIGNLDTLVARTQIDEADIARVAKGARAYVTAPAFPGRKFGGSVTDVSPRLGAKTIQTGAPTEKRDASVLDVLVTLDPDVHLPIGLRVDCFVLPAPSAS